jgi:hypothetical protein
VPGHAAQSRETTVTAELIQIRRGELGTVAGVVYWSEFIHGDDIYATPSAIQLVRARITTAEAQIHARLARGEMHCICDLVQFTVPWEPLTERLTSKV